MLDSNSLRFFRFYRQNVLRGAVAQLGARVNGIHEVAGSIPASSTKISDVSIHLTFILPSFRIQFFTPVGFFS